MKKAIAVLVAFVSVFAVYAPVIQSEVICKTDKEEFWLCRGDRAWINGYLVESSKMMKLVEKDDLFDEVLNERNEYKKLLDDLEKNSEAYEALIADLKDLLKESSVIRDEYKSQRDGYESDLINLESKYGELLDEQNDSWSTLEVVILTSGTVILSVFAGVGIYAVATL